MAIQRHVVVIPRNDGGIEIHPMKDWLRLHPDQMPPHLDSNPTKSTSWRLRNGLRKMGWTMEETPTEVRLLSPQIDKDKLGEVLEPPAADEDEDENPYFSLEYQLRDFLADNLGIVEINGKRLTLHKDENGDGVEYQTPVGPIDILATDNVGAFYVFELKRANSSDRAMGQVARYMGWIKQTIGKGKDVYGVIVARAISNNLKFARAVVPNVYLFEYEVSFTLKQAHELSTSPG